MSSMSEQAPPNIHLCVLVHGLWGNPDNLAQVASAIRNEFSDDILHVLVAKRNNGSFTYDGIELGGERVTHEIEEELSELERKGTPVNRISLVGYSLGGLVARYAIGLLYSKGIFDKIEPLNFTTFATPHLGVRTPLLGWHNQIFNVLGARTLSTSGRQLFLVDSFRDTGRPLIAILADANSIFMRGLSAFRKRSIYANIINDRAVPFYTAMISKTNPFNNLETLDIQYVPGYEDVIIESYDLAKPKTEQPTLYQSLSGKTWTILGKAPRFLLLTALLPLGSLVFLANSGFQTYKSAQRIRAHEEGTAGISKNAYRFPLMIEGMRRRAESALESMNAAQLEEYLEDQTPVTSHYAPSQNGYAQKPQVKRAVNGNAARPDDTGSRNTNAMATPTSADTGSTMEKQEGGDSIAPEKTSSFPVLALTSEQFAMIESLDTLKIQKYPVHIHKAFHSHAAIVVRTPKTGFSEGTVVIKHMLERFKV